MLVTPDLARRVDRAEIDFCALAALAGPAGAATLARGGGRAVYGAPGSPVNKVLGLGLCAEVTDADLDDIERFYEERACPVQIELCPLAAADLGPRLSGRGYHLQAFENELGRPAPPDAVSAATGADTTIEANAPEEDWLHVVSRGFAAPDHGPSAGLIAASTVSAVRDVMKQFAHPGLVRYLATVGGQPAAGALSFVSDGVLGIFGTATLPEYRRRGLQRAIVARAIDDARPRADFVMATTEPGSISQRTFERLGFQVLYTRVVLVRP